MARFPELSRMDRVALDTETTGLGWKDRPVGISYATPDGRSGYLRWGHPDGNNCTRTEAQEWVQEELHRPDLRVYFHNAAFDLRMLAYAGMEIGARVEDTGYMAALINELEKNLSLDGLGQKHTGMAKKGGPLWEYLAREHGGKPTRKAQAGRIARAPGDVVEEYAEFDAVLTLALADALRPRIYEPEDPAQDLRAVYELETSLIPFLHRLHMVGVRVDTGKARAVQGTLQAKYDEALQEWEEMTGERGLNYRGYLDLETLFRDHNLPIVTTDSGQPSFTKDRLAALDHPIPQQITRLRKLDRYRSTFVEKYILQNTEDDGCIHGEFHALRTSRYGARSGRFSSGGGLNLQNIPSRDPEFAPLIRGCFVPYRDMMQWAKLDYSQIEFRFFAHYAGGRVMEAYQDPDTDFHQLVADLAGIERTPAKTINFGTLFGMGKAKLGRSLGLTPEEVDAFLQEYHEAVPEMSRTFDKASRKVRKRGYIRTWGGRVRHFPRKGRHYDKEHVGLNALCQGSAADLIKLAMARVAEVVDWEHVIPHLTVHDELDFSVDPGEKGMDLLREIRDVMEDPGYQDDDPAEPFYRPRVPILVDAEVGPDWGHVDEIEL